MKKIILATFIILGSFVAQAQEIKWMTMEDALIKQKENPKPIFLYVYNDSGRSKLLDKNTLSDKAVVEMISGAYYAVKFNGEGDSKLTYKGVKYGNPDFVKGSRKKSQHDFVKFLKTLNYPTMYIFNTNGEIYKTIAGFRNPAELVKEL